MTSLAVFVFLTFPALLSAVFLEIPGGGSISAILNGPLRLNYKVDLPKEPKITWCFWEYSESSTSLAITQFVGFNLETQQRLNISSTDHVGWEFINKMNPCLGGIYREKAVSRHAGRYRMVLVDSNSDEIKSEFSTVTLYEENDLEITFLTDGDKRVRKLKDIKDGMLELPNRKGEKEKETSFTVQITKNFPPDTIIKMQKTSKDSRGNVGTDFSFRCEQGQLKCGAMFFLRDESDLVATATVDTGIVGYPEFHVVQRYDYNGVSLTGGHKAAIVFLFFFLAGLIGMVVYFVVLPFLKKRKEKKIKQDEENQHIDLDAQRTLLNQDKDNFLKEKKTLEDEIRYLKDLLKQKDLQLASQTVTTQNVGEKWKKLEDDHAKQSRDLLEKDNVIEQLKRDKQLAEEKCETFRKQIRDKGMPEFVVDPQSITVKEKEMGKVVISAKIQGFPDKVRWFRDISKGKKKKVPTATLR